MPRAVLLNSGGIDSRVSAAMLRASGDWEVHSLFIDWNPTVRDAAGLAARITADTYCDHHEVFAWPVDWMTWYPNLRKSTTPYAHLGTFALAAPFAQHVGADYIVSGVRREVSMDPAWFDAMKVVLNGNAFAGGKVFLVPVYEMTNEEVTAKAAELGVDLATTYSCTAWPACGECASCRRRAAEGLA